MPSSIPGTFVAGLVLTLATPGGPAGLRDGVRELLLQPCGACHRPSLPTANPRALLVFDLEEPAWDRKLSTEQTLELARRLRAARNLDPAESVILDDYVQARSAKPRRSTLKKE